MPNPSDELRASAARANSSFTLESLAAAVADCPLHKPQSWVEIELVGEDGNAVADAEYRLTLPDGEVRSGLTDANGKARADGFAAGTCQVCFPGLHLDSWDVAASG